jgi:hypothetical protein
MFTDLQKSRVRFHLGYPNDQIAGPRLEIEQNLVLNSLHPDTILAVAGDPFNQSVMFEGLELCSPTSLLGRLESAFAKLGPNTIDDSLFVQSAGKVNLRSDELRARLALYNQYQDELARVLDVRLFGGSPQGGPSHGY